MLHTLDIVPSPADGRNFIHDGDTLHVRTTEKNHRTWRMSTDPNQDGDRVHYEENNDGAAEKWIIHKEHGTGVVRRGEKFCLENLHLRGQYLSTSGGSVVCAGKPHWWTATLT